MTKKVEVVEITITDGHNYVDSVKDGMAFTSVTYSGGVYGGAFPCDNQEEVNEKIGWAKKSILNKGDKPKVVDKREKATLSAWM